MLAPSNDLPAIIGEAKAIFVDWDGCLAQNGKLLPGAADFLRLTSEKVFILSNNSTDLPEDFQSFLALEGVTMPTGRILLAGHQTVGFVAGEHDGKPIQLIANHRLNDHARRQGLSLAQSEAEVVVLLRDTGFSYTTLERAANRLRAGARLIVANPDLTHPGDDGAVVPETGALLAALGACVDLSTVHVEVIGKPSPYLFEFALSRADVGPGDALMIGDNPLTDVAGAERCGIGSILLAQDGPTIADLARAASSSPSTTRERQSWI